MTALILCTLLAITDGDTVRLDCGAGDERVRLFGLNCPERRDPGGPLATRTLRTMLDGRRIEIKRRGQDRYGRTVAKVFAGGRDVTCGMIRARVCVEFTKYSNGEYAECK